MARFAVDCSYYEFDQLIYSISWVKAKTKENAIDKLISKYDYIHIQNIRELLN